MKINNVLKHELKPVFFTYNIFELLQNSIPEYSFRYFPRIPFKWNTGRIHGYRNISHKTEYDHPSFNVKKIENICVLQKSDRQRSIVT